MPIAIEDLLIPGVDAPAVAFDGALATLTYPSAEAHAARVSDDVEALRSVGALALVASWSDAAAPLAVCLRYAPAPVVEAPRPVAPVPATPPRRR